jgi:hypothetical protein
VQDDVRFGWAADACQQTGGGQGQPGEGSKKGANSHGATSVATFTVTKTVWRFKTVAMETERPCDDDSDGVDGGADQLGEDQENGGFATRSLAGCCALGIDLRSRPWPRGGGAVLFRGDAVP